MIIFMYSNKVCEHQAIACIRSLEPRIMDDVQIVYFTIGFISTFTSKQLIKVPIPERNYPTFHYYKAELSLDVIRMFPEETNFVFTDTDVLFSHRIDFTKLTHTQSYPLGVFGPHEYPYIWEKINGEMIVYDEKKLMQYLNVQQRSVNYQWSCLYTFNKDCVDFFEEYTSLCKNEYLIQRRKYYFPVHDETAFNVCLWKRGATESLGYAFVNTHKLKTVKLIEESNIQHNRLGENIDALGADWEYIHDSTQVMFYHGFKEQKSTEEALNYLLSV
jgi:hypothetical protein